MTYAEYKERRQNTKDWNFHILYGRVDPGPEWYEAYAKAMACRIEELVINDDSRLFPTYNPNAVIDFE